MLQTVRVFAIATVGWSSAGLDIASVPCLWAYGAEEGTPVKGAGPNFHIERL
jgi:hypothetical protein